jgi:alpha-beta hydrolase superfamily lysophospholipase
VIQWPTTDRTWEALLNTKKWTGDIVFLLIVGALVVGWMRLYPAPADSPFAPIEATEDLQADDLPTYASPDGLALAYRLYEPQGEPHHVLIFFHDTLLHGGWYAVLGRDLAAQGVAVYLPDRRGWGRSEGDRDALSEEAGALIEDITALIAVAQSRYPQREVFLGGHGRGAALAMRYVAANRPVAGVILVSPYVTEDQPNLRPDAWQTFGRAHPIEALLARSGLDNWRAWHYRWPEPMVEADPLLETRFSIAWMEQMTPEDAAATYRALTVPLLCVQGREDPLFDVDRTAECMALFPTSDRQLETVPDAGYLSVINVAANPIAHWLAGR